MKHIARKSLIASALLLAFGAAQAEVKTFFIGEEFDGLTATGSGTLTLSSNLIAAMNVGQISFEEFGGAVANITRDASGAYTSLAVSAEGTSLTIDTVTRDVVALTTTGGATLTATAIQGVSSGGFLTISDIAFNVPTKTVFATVIGGNGVGTVSNVAQFGAFIDLGVHQDGLVHVSQLAHKFVNDAREVVKTGDIVKVKVMEVDVERKRIGLSMKLDAAPPRQGGDRGAPRDNRFEAAGRGQRTPQRGAVNAPQPGSMASAFAKLQGLKK